ncbi:uncharacterized protein BO80DRAFT_94467 [Aspergillus ibericus CBS 121593]|uniref:Uncharacterized protein n=1 Tax=Aspergillus ibericus CBS 121593 TaxID=1448316 RepID=A0A395GYI3_9EURO|nr:hypothetical protein BO80DRAFT_94467 [Aspergillus ibericus CBS 121593]RAL00651.1 hypothetical protein BO80DRAFT_94467 [Aspergillus ibericus CBS 121593]
MDGHRYQLIWAPDGARPGSANWLSGRGGGPKIRPCHRHIIRPGLTVPDSKPGGSSPAPLPITRTVRSSPMTSSPHPQALDRSIVGRCLRNTVWSRPRAGAPDQRE